MARKLRLRRPLLTLLFASMTFVATLLVGIFSNKGIEVNLFGNEPIAVLTGTHLALTTRVDTDVQSGYELTDNVVLAKEGEWSYCDYTLPAEPSYAVELVQVNVDEAIVAGSVFAVDMVFKNTGNTRLFSFNAGCSGLPMLNVGTQKTQDRESVLGRSDLMISGWLSAGRVAMTDDYADPDSTFHVIFQSIAPEGDNIYREFFQPVVEGKAWISEPFGVDVTVGTPTEQMTSDIGFVQDVSMAATDLSGLQRNIEVELATQTMHVRFGETTVWDLTVSTGAYATPTPRGTYQILSKQELRIGGQAPHYRMPYFQMWDSRGYGLHALPYLATDGGVFWSEALTHIGIPVSHGCIRMLPDDAVLLYNFTDIGTPIVVY
jgi:hypothetical protein